MSERYSAQSDIAALTTLSLGHTTLEANGLMGNPVITGNYVSPQHELPLPWPDGDWYLRQTFVPAVQAGETVICNTLIPGLRDYYRQTGLLPANASVVEVEPSVTDRPHYGFPHTDPLARLGVSLETGSTNYLCSTFGGAAITAQATRAGLETIARAPSDHTNNKARLREASRQYGFAMLPGTTIGDAAELPAALAGDWNTDHGSWLKLATGSGGDLVQHLPGRVTEPQFHAAVNRLRAAVQQAFSAGEFEQTYAAYWPNTSLTPGGYPLVLEADASVLGPHAVNGSTQFVASQNGEVRILGHFRLTTTAAGEYLGNEPFVDLSPAAQRLAEEQARLVAGYNAEAHGYFGIQAIDWFVDDTPGNEPQLAVGELNSRPTANTPPFIMAQKLGAGHFVNTNVYTDRPVRVLEDFVATVGTDLAYGDAQADGLVAPQAFRTLVTRSAIFASPDFKIAILGRSEACCRRIAAQLVARGVRFQP